MCLHAIFPIPVVLLCYHFLYMFLSRTLLVDITILLVALVISVALLFEHSVTTSVTIDTKPKPYFRPVDPTVDLIFGNPAASVFIVEYGDLECPYCRDFHPDITTFMKSDWGLSGRVAWVWRDGFHINQTSVEKAKVLACIRRHGGSDSRQKAWAFIAESLAGGVEEQVYPYERYQEIITSLALPFERIETCRKRNEVAEVIEEAFVDIRKLNITETPRLQFISQQGELIFDSVGALTTTQLEEFIASILSNTSDS